MDKLASVQIISKISPAENSDNLEIAQVLGWQVVVKKGEFKEGDKCIYVSIDSILPNKPEYEFLKGHNRIRTVKLRGNLSQGICFPVCDPSLEIDTDMTEVMGVVKYEKPLANMGNMKPKGNWPSFLIKTDEPRLQNYPNVLKEPMQLMYATLKYDGTSATYYVRHTEFGPEFGICSRNLELKEDGDNVYTRIAKQYNIKEKLIALGKNIAIQGEIIGEGIQKNPLKIKGIEFRIFNLFDIDTGKYLGKDDLMEACEKINIPMVDQIAIYYFDKEPPEDRVQYSVPDLVKFATTLEYAPGIPAEGMVIRSCKESYSEAIKGRLSFKVLNNEYLLKNKE